jgi:hypothetical protein
MRFVVLLLTAALAIASCARAPEAPPQPDVVVASDTVDVADDVTAVDSAQDATAVD